MKTLSVIFELVVSLHNAVAQIENEMLDINNFHVPVNSEGMIGVVEGTGNFSEVPAGSNISAFYISALWIGAKEHITGEVMGSVPTYHPGNNPFRPGPVYYPALTPYRFCQLFFEIQPCVESIESRNRIS